MKYGCIMQKETYTYLDIWHLWTLWIETCKERECALIALKTCMNWTVKMLTTWFTRDCEKCRDPESDSIADCIRIHTQPKGDPRNYYSKNGWDVSLGHVKAYGPGHVEFGHQATVVPYWTTWYTLILEPGPYTINSA